MQVWTERSVLEVLPMTHDAQIRRDLELAIEDDARATDELRAINDEIASMKQERHQALSAKRVAEKEIRRLRYLLHEQARREDARKRVRASEGE